MKQYFLDRDNSAHWYLVEADRRDEWNRWRDLDEDNPTGWIAPPFSARLNTHLSRIVFENPKEKLND